MHHRTTSPRTPGALGYLATPLIATVLAACQGGIELATEADTGMTATEPATTAPGSTGGPDTPTSAGDTGSEDSGGGVIGATDDVDQLPMGIDPDTLETLPPEDDTGVVLTGSHIHLALREMASVSGGAPAQKFKLPGEILPIFG